MSFRVPDSSSPPSTPDRHHRLSPDGHPSTTPAGPPPSSLTGFSTTPAGNPPASSFLGNRSNTSAVPFPSFTSANRHGTSGGSLTSQQQYDYNGLGEYGEEEEDEGVDAMDEDSPAPRDLVAYSQNTADDQFRSAEALNLKEIAKGLAKPPSLREPDGVTLQTEEILSRAFQQNSLAASSDGQHLGAAVQSLLGTWARAFPYSSTSERIGPSDREDLTAQAFFIANFLLQLHHPSFSKQGDGLSRPHANPFPAILLRWLQRHHWPLRDDFEDCFSCNPNPIAHTRFWDVLYNTTLRGDLQSTLELLQSADLRYAATAFEDGAPGIGYEGKQLVNSRVVFQRAIEVLQTCPGLQSDDWDVKGAGWAIFRRKVQQALSDLENFAEGNSADRYTINDTTFEASHFGMTNPETRGLSVSQRSRQAESKVPWTIYQNLKYFYGQLMGTPNETIAASIDWLEATIGITAWWNGDDEDGLQQDMANSRRLNRSLRKYQERLVDTHPQAAYLRKLSQALVVVQDGQGDEDEDADLAIDPTDAVQVALGCAMINEHEGLVRILRGLSPVIANAVVEIADMGQWLGRARPVDGMIDGFNQSDLMVLSYAQQRGLASDHDTALSQYAELLVNHEQVKDGTIVRAGWQLAIGVFGRLHDETVGAKRIVELLNELDIRDARQVDETIQLCNRMGLHEQSKRVSEVRFLKTFSSQFNY